MSKTIVITGASSGIGHVCATHLSALGFDVVAGVRRPEDATRFGETPIRPVLLDVTDADSVGRLARQLAGRPLAGLVNNAGIAVGGPLELVALDDLRHQLEVNVVGLVAITQALLEPLREGRGRVVNIGSMSGLRAAPFVGPYAASKHAVEALTDALRQELRPWGMHVAVIEPGLVDTPIWAKSRAATDAAEAALSPRGRALYGSSFAPLRTLIGRTAERAMPATRVAAAVEHALTARRPRTRYPLGLEVRAQIGLSALLPDRAMDALVARATGL